MRLPSLKESTRVSIEAGESRTPVTPADEPRPEPVSGTALGPAEVRDTPYVEPPFEDEAEDADSDDPWIGRLLSNVYEVEERIGVGGMGAVYRARHVHLEKPFAIKVLTDAVAERAQAVERLKQEAVAASRIDHENICRVVNFDRADGGAVFIVMEYLEGESLAAALGRGPIALRRALPITYQLCRALHAAHEHGIVHRDLKPENVFLTQQAGRQLVKVLDFGISKVRRAQAEQVRMTRTGQLVGTPLYMSPEQAKGESDVDRRADLYATGVILFEMIAGAPPFEGRNYFELLWKHGNEPAPSIATRNPNVYAPAGLEAALERALAKDPDARFPTMEAFEAALLAAVPEVPALPPPVSLPPEPPRGTAVRERRLRPSARPTADAPRAAATTTAPTESLRVPVSRRGPLIAVVVGGLLSLAAVVIALGRTPVASAPEDVPPEPDGAAEAAAPPAPPGAELASGDPASAPADRAADEEEAAAPAAVSVHLESRPPGAEVKLGERVLGRTPLVVGLEPTTDAQPLTFHLAGHRVARIDVVPRDGREVPPVRLPRRRPAREAPDPLPMKTGL
ncbi:MAG: serine/threonine-protein kinase [Sandaracinaceae bacterium]